MSKKIKVFGAPEECKDFIEKLKGAVPALIVEHFSDESSLVASLHKLPPDLILMIKRSIIESTKQPTIIKNLLGVPGAERIIFLGLFEGEKEAALEAGAAAALDLDNPETVTKIASAVERPRIAFGSEKLSRLFAENWVEGMVFQRIDEDFEKIKDFRPTLLLLTPENITESDFTPLKKLKKDLTDATISAVVPTREDPFKEKAKRGGVRSFYYEEEGLPEVRRRIEERLSKEWRERLRS